MGFAKLATVAAVLMVTSGVLSSMTCLAWEAGMAPVGPLPADDIFAPYVDQPSHVMAVVSEEVKDGIRIMRLRFASVEGAADSTTHPNEIYAILARPTSLALAHTRPDPRRKAFERKVREGAVAWFRERGLPQHPRWPFCLASLDA
ncbi:MAG: hypothetical protein ABSD48_16530 [Armatimonadota bacterium]|jgi:hypothetical protein